MSKIENYVRNSSHSPMRKVREWAQGRPDLNADIIKVQWAIVWCITILVFALIVLAENIHIPQQVGLP